VLKSSMKVWGADAVSNIWASMIWNLIHRVIV
jgi:hypothetical protein